jgi:hypothetical protein
MIDLSRDIHSLTDFKRKTAGFMKQLKETGHPVVLTVNGRPNWSSRTLRLISSSWNWPSD